MIETLKQNAGGLVLLLVALAVFAGAYYYFVQTTPERENIVNGIRVFAKGPVKAGIAELLAPSQIPMQVVFANSSDNFPCKLPMQTETIYALAVNGKNTTLQLKTRGGELCEIRLQNNASQMTQCVKPRIVVENGECDCMRLDRQNELIRIEGSEEWLCANAVNVREVIRWGLQ